MSELRQRAREVKQQGAIRRRNWSPTTDSAHYKVYRYWQRKSGKYRTRENFCHYWRVVLIWGPMRWAGMMLGYLLPGMAAIGLIWLTVIFWPVSWQVGLMALGIVAAAMYLAAGLSVYAHLAYLAMPDKLSEFRVKRLDGRKSLAALAAFATSPVGIIIAVIGMSFGPIIVFLVQLKEEYDLYRKVGRWLLHARPGAHQSIKWIRPWMAVPAVPVALSPWHEWAQVLTAIMAAFALFIGVVVLIAFLADRSRSRAEMKRDALRLSLLRTRNEKALLARYEILYARLEITTNYADWLMEYKEWFRKRFGADALEANPDSHIEGIRHAIRDSQWAALLEPEAAPARPNKSRRLMSGLADLLVLIWSIVLVNKWKTCPLVELPRD